MADAVETVHPDYSDRLIEWQTMRRSYRGATQIKRETQEYLPMPSGYRAQADQGIGLYTAYITRAQFPEIVEPTVQGMVGIIHRSAAQIKLPTALKPLIERCTKDGLPLEVFHRKITQEILTQGRYGVLAEVSEEGADTPFLAGYVAENVRNWDENATLFVLDESGKVRNGYTWNDSKKFRVLELTGGRYSQKVYENGNPRTIEINARANKPMEAIPFVIAGPTELAIKPQNPPLLGVANAALAIYRLDADLRSALFWSGQETLFIIGLPAETAVPQYCGSGIVVGLPAGCEAKYVGVAANGLSAMRQAIIDERENAVAAGAKLFDAAPQGAEAAEAMRIRLAAQTATLTTVSMSSCAALEKALRHAAVFVGADPNDVIVKPNVKLIDTALPPSDAKALMELWMGNAISYTTLYENLQRGEIASPERTADQEQSLIEVEAPLEPPDVDDDPDNDDAPPEDR